ncbi:MAG: Wzz/FepE/Etk N-terminal domain-containing protein, partial [Myxococcota bacterium]
MSDAPPSPRAPGLTRPTEASPDAGPKRWSAQLRKYWMTAVAMTALVLTGTVFYTLGQKKIYQAQGTVLVDPRPPRPLGQKFESFVDMGSSSFFDNQEFYKTQHNLLQSRRVALAVVRDLGLQHDPGFLQNLPPGAEPENPVAELSPEQVADMLRSRLGVEPVRDSRLAKVTYLDANPERAQRILGTLLERYIEQNLENALASTSKATDWLRNQLDTLKTDLESREMELHEYKKDKDILSVEFDAKSNMLGKQMEHLTAEMTRVQAELQRVTAKRRVLNTVPTDDPTAIESNELLQSPLLNTLRADYYAAVRMRDAQLGARKGPNHPDVARAQKQVDAAKVAILKEVKNIKKAVGREVAVLAGHAGGLAGMLDKAKQQA